MSTMRAKRNRTIRRITGMLKIAVIGVVQAVGTIAVGVGGVVLKAAAVLMIAAVGVLFFFTDFSGMNTLVVALASAIMFWLPEFVVLILAGMAFLQGKVADTFM